jgi:hypothetical protein
MRAARAEALDDHRETHGEAAPEGSGSRSLRASGGIGISTLERSRLSSLAGPLSGGLAPAKPTQRGCEPDRFAQPKARAGSRDLAASLGPSSPRKALSPSWVLPSPRRKGGGMPPGSTSEGPLRTCLSGSHGPAPQPSVLMAVAERLGVEAIATLDLKDLGAGAPKGGPKLWPRDL